MAKTSLRVLLLTHASLVPPDKATAEQLEAADWRAEYDVRQALKSLGHDVQVTGLSDDLGVLREAITEVRPHIAFNLTEEFAGVGTFDQNIVSYLELLGVRYTGCNPRGLILARDKSLAKKILSFHRIPTPSFEVFPKGAPVKRPSELEFPLIIKSLNEEASLGISQASVVSDDSKLEERVAFIHETVGSDALAESYVEGRELYVGVLGNARVHTFPVWELHLPQNQSWPIATQRVKWSHTYREKHGIYSSEAKNFDPQTEALIHKTSRRVYRLLGLSGYARMDLRVTPQGRVFVIEANPNPHIGNQEDFAQSALKAGLTYPQLITRILNLGLRWRPAPE